MRSAPSLHAQSPALILLVDDNRHGLVARRSVFEELGYQVISAHCGQEALALAGQHSFDLVVTDFRMPAMDGVALIAELRNRGFVMPVILLSGFIEPLGLNTHNTGADLLVQKSANEMTHLVRGAKRLLNTPKKPMGQQAKAISKRKTADQ